MNTGNTYYFISDTNNICRQEYGVKKEESEVLELYELIEDINNLVEENEKLKKENEKFNDDAEEYNLDAMSYQTLYEQQLEKNKQLENENKKLKQELLREETIERLITVLDKYKENEKLKQGYTMAVMNLVNVVEHIEKCYEFDIEFSD